jgi:hypothetical protein
VIEIEVFFSQTNPMWRQRAVHTIEVVGFRSTTKPASKIIAKIRGSGLLAGRQAVSALIKRQKGKNVHQNGTNLTASHHSSLALMLQPVAFARDRPDVRLVQQPVQLRRGQVRVLCICRVRLPVSVLSPPS